MIELLFFSFRLKSIDFWSSQVAHELRIRRQWLILAFIKSLFRFLHKNKLTHLYPFGVFALNLRFTGKIGKGSRRTTFLFLTAGDRFSLHTFSNRILFASKTTYAKYGAFSLKVWMCFKVLSDKWFVKKPYLRALKEEYKTTMETEVDRLQVRTQGRRPKRSTRAFS